jgi:UTP:GlnB (protein PII) uridylyltransferase
VLKVIVSCSGFEEGEMLLLVFPTQHIKPNLLEPQLLSLSLFFHDTSKEG